MTDAINEFFVKRSPASWRRQQGDAIDSVYAPFAREVDLPPCTLPNRPTPARLVELAASEHGSRLRDEWLEASSDLLITLGEEARRVASTLADNVNGPPARALASDDGSYGRPGSITIAGHSARWMALTHPGNRSASWQPARDEWRRWARAMS